MNRIKGFTLIELLAVVIILGILAFIAIPVVSEYISDSKDSSYISSAKGIINGARNLSNSSNLDLNDPTITYYIPAKYIKTENDYQSPYGDFTEAYVGVIADKDKHSYFWASTDTSTHGIKKITNQYKLEADLVKDQVQDIDISTAVETTGIEDRTRIWILNLDGTWQAERTAKYNLTEDGEIEPADTMLAIFVSGSSFNNKVKKLANGDSATSDTIDNNIKYIKRSETEPSDNNKKEKNIISDSNSEVPIYAWFDNGTIYWWSEDYKPNLNSNANYMFYNLRSLKDVELDKIKTNLTTEMALMFFNCKDLEKIDVSKFDTSKVTNMNGMFMVQYAWNSSSIYSKTTEIIGLDKFDTSNVKYMVQMFYGQYRLRSLDLRNFNTSKVLSMAAMFSNCRTLENVNLSGWDTSNVVNMGQMFQHNTYLKKVDLSSFDTSKVVDFSYMFGCGGSGELCKLTEVKGIEKFNTTSVTNMKMMFVHQTSLRTLDLSGWDTRNVLYTQGMFAGTNLTKIYVSNSFKLSDATESAEMFTREMYTAGISSSSVLTGGAGTTYDPAHTDKEYARIDDPANGKPGYFTLKTN